MEVEIAQKHNQKSDAIRQISGLVFLTVAIIFIFNVIDLFFGLDENLAKKNAVVEENEKMILYPIKINFRFEFVLLNSYCCS